MIPVADNIHDASRQRMIEETSRFIEWGLRHPELVVRIPAKPEGEGGWPEGVGRFFWTTVLRPRDIRQAGTRIFRRLASRLRGN
ncbi:MAG: hypothetical protein BIFFINMI_01275 [Phycisphaerae bacterium]|nr:hypothetical protein [Phycisphaerae bacterium]